MIPDEIRRRAEALLRADYPLKDLVIPKDLADIVHELQVHQIQLELQNDELRRAQKELELTRDKFADLYDFAPVGYVTIGPDGLIMEANLTLTMMLGIERSRLLKRPFSFLVDARDRPEYFGYRRRLFEIGTLQQCETRLIKKDASYLYVMLDGIPVQDQMGRVYQVRLAISDISARKQAETELQMYRNHLEQLVNDRTVELELEIGERKLAEFALRQAKETAEMANRAKSVFLAKMSHELRTPLNAVLGYAQILQNDQTLTAAQQEEIAVIRRSGEHLLTLISDILDLSRIEADRLELHPTEFDLPSFLKNIVEMFQARVEQKGIKLYYVAATSLPIWVLADEKHLRQILINLLDNAVKFTDQGKVALRVNAQPAPVEALREPLDNTPRIRLTIEVEDTGPGIPADRFDEIFEPFRQFPAQDGFADGTGLGLAISQRLARLMGGTLRVSSIEGQSSCFRLEVTLPLGAPLEISEPVIVGLKTRPCRVLIVDDIVTSSGFLRDGLVGLGFEVLEASNGLEGLARAEQFRPHVILTDIHMPYMDGLDMARLVRQSDILAETVIIVVSASAFEADRDESMAAGCNDFLSKPINITRLLHMLTRHLQLEWIYARPEQSIHEGIIGPIGMGIPPVKELTALHRLARSGDIRAILQHLEGILAELYPAFTTELRRLAEQYEINKIRELIEQHLKKEKS